MTVSQQLKRSVQDPHGIMGEFGDLKTAAEMRKYMAKNAAISISPVGQRLLGVFDKIATATQEAEQSSIANVLRMEYAKKSAAVASKFGLNPDDPNFHQMVSVEMEKERNFQPKEKVLDSGVIQIETAPGKFEHFSPRTRSTGVLPEIERIFQKAADEGKPFSEEEKEEAREYRLGLIPKPEISRSAFIAKNYASALKLEPFKTEKVPGRFYDGTKETPLTPEEIIVDLGNRYDQIYGGSSESVTPQESDPTFDGPMFIRQPPKTGQLYFWNGSSYEPSK
ncbi:MAG: hypothetical protein O2960_20015 [Verrucomicrobia bacterium]|nr:hypothetical protein [Verrucomicrobiota bacterium]